MFRRETCATLALLIMPRETSSLELPLAKKFPKFMTGSVASMDLLEWEQATEVILGLGLSFLELLSFGIIINLSSILKDTLGLDRVIMSIFVS